VRRTRLKILISTQAIHKGEMSGARSRTVLLVEFMETHKVSPLRHVGLAGPCGAARKPAVPTRADLCYGVVDREIVATKCAGGSIEGTVPSGVSH